MPVSCTVTPGGTYGAKDTVTDANLNAIAEPAVEMPDDVSPIFNRTFLGNGTKAAPTLTFKSEPTSGFYRKSAGVIGCDILDADIWSATVDGIVMETGKTFAGALLAPVGALNSPTITFAGHPTHGFWYDAGAVHLSFGAFDAWYSTEASTTFNHDVKFNNDVVMQKSLTVAGDVTASGTITGALGNIASGTAAAPGLPLAADADTGFYRPTVGVSNTHRFGLVVGETPIFMVGRKGGTSPFAVFTHSETDVDYSSSAPAMATFAPGAGFAPVSFGTGSQVSAGSSSISITNAPSLGTVRYVKAWIEGVKCVVPVIQHTW